jgi:DNA-binding transcriptional ArsR family regulator
MATAHRIEPVAATYSATPHSATLPATCDIAGVAALLADPGRAAILSAVLDGRSLPAGELARVAGVTPATASTHLAKLVDGGLLVAERHGRHRYFRLADASVAHAIEMLATVARPRVAATAKEAYVVNGIRFARSCYDHLAGRLGVEVVNALVAREALVHDERGFAPGKEADASFGALGVDIDEVSERARRSRRPLTRECLDWSERRLHLAGALGAALLAALIEREWLARVPSGRALRVTNEGRRAFRRELGIVTV